MLFDHSACSKLYLIQPNLSNFDEFFRKKCREYSLGPIKKYNDRNFKNYECNRKKCNTIVMHGHSAIYYKSLICHVIFL